MYEIKADSGNAETKWSQQTVCNGHRTGMPGVRHQEFNYALQDSGQFCRKINKNRIV